MHYVEILANSSLVFTGFTVLLFALRESEGPRIIFRAWSIVAQGFIIFGMSLLPLLLVQLGLDEQTLWQIASGAAFLATLAFLVSIPKISIQLTKGGYPPLAPAALWSAVGISSVGCLFLLANLVGWPLAPSSFLYGAGLTLFLAVGVAGVVGIFWLQLAGFIKQRVLK
jgi:hypothetical protein